MEALKSLERDNVVPDGMTTNGIKIEIRKKIM